MTTLFDPVQAGSLHLANRIVMAPLTRNRAPGAIPTALMATYYTQRAGAGLIITEATAISHQGQGYADVPGIWSDAQVAAWKHITDSVHAAGGKIVIQLWHVGRVSHVDLQPGGGAPVAPSAITAKTKTVLIHDGIAQLVETSAPRALRLDEMPGLVADYRHAARCAMRAGFDGVELHAANGYLLDQFLRSSSNHRTDAYGGAVENRARLLIEVMQAVAQEIGDGKVGIRLSPVTPAAQAPGWSTTATTGHWRTSRWPKVRTWWLSAACSSPTPTCHGGCAKARRSTRPIAIRFTAARKKVIPTTPPWRKRKRFHGALLLGRAPIQAGLRLH